MVRRSDLRPLRPPSAALLVALAPVVLAVACGPTGGDGQANAAQPSAAAAQAQAGTPGGAAGTAQDIDWNAVDSAMGRTGAMQPGDVRRYSLPRSDMQVSVRGVRLKPALALGSWVAFKAHGDGAMAMGDLVLSEHEVAPVMSKLQEGGIEQTAVHHHVLHETPRVLYMHVHAQGDPVKIAQAVRAAVALTKTPPAPAPPTGAAQRGGDKGDAGGAAGTAGAGRIDLDTAAIARVLGTAGKVNGGVYQVSVPRAEAIRDAGMEVPASMGLATAMNFQPTGGGKAAITGDFVMTAGEVNAVIRALRQNAIEVTSLHNHLLQEEPRLFFMHFWANADAVTLARGLRAALDETNSRREVGSR
jgi:hypothetical protein